MKEEPLQVSDEEPTKLNIGRFAILIINTHPFEWLWLFAHLVPVHVQQLDEDTALYIAFSPLFEAVDPNEPIPDYQIQRTVEDDGSVTIKAVRINKVEPELQEAA